jgi:hypothetical protein
MRLPTTPHLVVCFALAFPAASMVAGRDAYDRRISVMGWMGLLHHTLDHPISSAFPALVPLPRHSSSSPVLLSSLTGSACRHRVNSVALRPAWQPFHLAHSLESQISVQHHAGPSLPANEQRESSRFERLIVLPGSFYALVNGSQLRL